MRERLCLRRCNHQLAHVSAGEAGVIIRFFTPQGQLITEIRPGSPAYDEALRLALG